MRASASMRFIGYTIYLFSESATSSSYKTVSMWSTAVTVTSGA